MSGLGFLASDLWEMVQVELADSSDEGRAAAIAAIEIEQLNNWINCTLSKSQIDSGFCLRLLQILPSTQVK